MQHPGSDEFALEGALQFLQVRLVVEDAEFEGIVSGVRARQEANRQAARSGKEMRLSPCTHRLGLGAGRLRYS